jgi:putative oxidoreductase
MGHSNVLPADQQNQANPQKIGKPMKLVLWIVQSLLAVLFMGAGCMKLFAFEKITAQMPALADQHGLVIFIGTCEVAGALGLILPGLTKIMPFLMTWAAAGLATIMVLATGFHLMRGEYSHVPITLTIFALAAFVVYGRGFRIKAT